MEESGIIGAKKTSQVKKEQLEDREFWYNPQDTGKREEQWKGQKKPSPRNGITACLRQAACQAHREGRLREKSGKRGSNPRQPAWKADCHTITVWLLSNGSTGQFTAHLCYSRVSDRECCNLLEAECHQQMTLVVIRSCLMKMQGIAFQ
jgi:hypothetical protein